MPTIEQGETFLGDGLYVSFDGYQLRLRAPRAGGDHEVFLEPAVWTNLLNYVTALRQAQQQALAAISMEEPDVERS